MKQWRRKGGREFELEGVLTFPMNIGIPQDDRGGTFNLLILIRSRMTLTLKQQWINPERFW
jgi:hypothetical protein